MKGLSSCGASCNIRVEGRAHCCSLFSQKFVGYRCDENVGLLLIIRDKYQNIEYGNIVYG